MRADQERAPATACLLVLSDLCAGAATMQLGEADGWAAPAPVTTGTDPYRGVPPLAGGLECPVCRGPMQAARVPGVDLTIDTCSHGTWFDARELWIFSDALRSAASSQGVGSATAGEGALRGPPSSTVLDSAVAFGDAAGMVFELLKLLLGD